MPWKKTISNVSFLKRIVHRKRLVFTWKWQTETTLKLWNNSTKWVFALTTLYNSTEYSLTLDHQDEGAQRNEAAPEQNQQAQAAPVMHPQHGGLVQGAFRLLSGIVSIPISVLKTSFHFCRVVISFSLTTTAQLLLPSGVQGGVSATI